MSKSKNGKKKWGRNSQKDGRPNQYDKRNEGTGRERSNGRTSAKSGRSGREMEARNDISWYSKYPELLAAAGSLPYPWRPGMSIPMGSVLSPDGSKMLPSSYKIPGVMAFEWAPSVGVSLDALSPASIACKELYARVRAVYSGSLDADPPDFMIYLMALDSIYSYIASLKRIYRVLNAYTPYNFAIPERLFSALTGNYNSANFRAMQADKTRFYGAINELIHMTEKFVCPAVMDIFNRHYWMSDNVYCDANTANSQQYLFVQGWFYKFAMLDTPQGVLAGGLSLTQMPRFDTATVPDPVSMLFNYGVSLIDALAASDDGYTITGYLLRAFGDAPTFTVDLLNQDEVLELKYDEEVLSQIENALSLPDYVEVTASITKGNWNITQDPTINAVHYMPLVQYASSTTSKWYKNGEELNIFNNIRSDLPTVEDSVIATRLKSWLEPLVGNETDFVAYGATEIVLRIFEPSAMGSTSPFPGEQNMKQYMFASSNALISDALYNLISWTSFDWAPLLYLIMVPSSTVANVYPLTDIHNLTVVDKTTLMNLNKVCLYSEFNAFNI